MTTDLFVLHGEVSVTVTREEHHQSALGRYPVGGGALDVTAELAWCTIGSGKYRGQGAIEVRLDGERVGELTYAMSVRYGAMLDLVNGQGYRAGCAAVLFLGKRGVEIELRMPRETSEIVFPVARPTAVTATAGKKGVRKPAWIAAGVVGAFLVIGIIGSQGDKSPSAGSGPIANVTTSTSTSTSKATATTTTSSAVVEAPPATTTSTEAAPPPKPATPDAPAPKATKTTKAAPPPKETPAPPPASKCDPNYSGCVPVASDVDCAGGEGNGPAYVSGPIRVIGTDIYKLDGNKDGVACE